VDYGFLRRVRRYKVTAPPLLLFL